MIDFNGHFIMVFPHLSSIDLWIVIFLMFVAWTIGSTQQYQ